MDNEACLQKSKFSGEKMQTKLSKFDQQPVQLWQGGKTRELYIFQGEDGDSIFEITSSTMDYPETEYSIFEGYDRILMVIDGETVLTHEDGKEAKLTPLVYDEFSGRCKTVSRGLATDYEIMR